MNEKSIDNNLEEILVRNIVHCLGGNSADITMSALIRVMQSLIVGGSKSKEHSLEILGRLTEHLKIELEKQPEENFGYLRKNPNDDDPIVHDKQVKL